MSAVKKQESHAVAQTSESSSLLAVTSRAASDPNVDLDKMERLLAMQERIVARQAEALFASALSEMQDELPSVGERGDAAGRYTYALWEIGRAHVCTPVTNAHLVCRLLLAKKKVKTNDIHTNTPANTNSR